ncbi:MAG: hypothetical protein J6Y98_10025 [Bacteroidales bacterium]|nr:hypothetical protein [Bacteroidales bacterium]
MAKKIMFFCAIAIIFASCSTKKYDENLTKAFASAQICYASSGLIIDNTTSVWHTAIFDHEDSHGRYCSDFNSALRILFNDYEEKDVFSTADEYQEEMKTAVASLANGPKSRKEAYDDIMEIATKVNLLCEMAKDPSGSLQSYREQTRETFFSLKEKLEAFEMKYGEFLVKEILQETNND